jgi:hypothetical protein
VHGGNSLIGYAGDEIAARGVTVLPGGNYLVCSPFFANSIGAVTWCNGLTGNLGYVGSYNSLLNEAAARGG